MATIGWIDYSTNYRNRVGSVLDLLRPEGLVDAIHDSGFSDEVIQKLDD